MIDAFPLLLGVGFGVGASLGALALAFLLVGLVLHTVMNQPRWMVQVTPRSSASAVTRSPPPLVVTRTITPGEVYERPHLHVAPPPPPTYSMAATLSPTKSPMYSTAATLGYETDEMPGPTQTSPLVNDTNTGVLLETPDSGAWKSMPRPGWAVGDRDKKPVPRPSRKGRS